MSALGVVFDAPSFDRRARVRDRVEPMLIQALDCLARCVKDHGIVRDAFVSRLIAFLRSEKSLLQVLDLPQRVDQREFRALVQDMPTSPLKAMEEGRTDPLYYLRVAMEERHGVGLYLAQLPRRWDGIACYIADDGRAWDGRMASAPSGTRRTMHPIHTSDIRLAKRLWRELGGVLRPLPATGEMQWRHALFPRPLRTNDRRQDVPAKVLSLIKSAPPTRFGKERRLGNDGFCPTRRPLTRFDAVSSELELLTRVRNGRLSSSV